MKRTTRVLLFVLGLGALGIGSLYATSFLAFELEGPAVTYDLALADLDGDGDLDAFLANGRNEMPEPNRVLVNDGTGRFRDSGQHLGDFKSQAVIVEDFDDDGDLDALVANPWGEFFYNEGNGTFGDAVPLELPSQDGFYFGLWRFRAADLNANGQLDLFLVACCGGGYHTNDGAFVPGNPFNAVWLDGSEWGSQQLGRGSTEEVALVDLDGDGDLDAFGANSFFISSAGEPVTDPNTVWLNDGSGHFVATEREYGDARSRAVAAGDVDGDGDQDVLVGNDGPDEVWLNDGQGQFSNTGQALGGGRTHYVALTDFDGDGDPDALLADERQATLWLNDGRGVFRYSGQRARYYGQRGVAVGDVDGDGAPDIVVANVDAAKVWLNNGEGALRRH